MSNSEPKSLRPPQPVHFPLSKDLAWQTAGSPSWEHLDLSPEVVERLALVLSGINPIVLTDLPNKRGGSPRNIHQLRCDGSLGRVSPSRELANDHRCVLWPFFRTNEKSFAELWQNSRSVAGGQDSTLLIKQVHWLKKINMAAPDAALAKAIDTIDVNELVKMSPKILFFLFRTAIRHIDRDCNQKPPQAAVPSLQTRLLQKISGKKAADTPAIYFPSSILRETESYLETSLTVARILVFARSQVKQQRA
ncbi:hypothetical protein LF1_24930 [Rubripirellula obstinata]|uniref:Uncharacterized protein n=1 Tax=Rubripirellula obstinata TaxID=406547 RepID=A0A5B1CJ51_9BACT|nr:hypothetical protein [Rubripirellula obstinata]KAA1259955.1 hypothetical protein LF1_24930 [Rubripirellula obstinata]